LPRQLTLEECRETFLRRFGYIFKSDEINYFQNTVHSEGSDSADFVGNDFTIGINLEN
jgi:hypothetical protein